MKSGDIFSDNDPHLDQPATNQVRTVCGVCKELININTIYRIDDMASCYVCWSDHKITRNVCPRPYRLPKSRSRLDRATYKSQSMPSSVTTVAATQAFINGPNGGL